MKLLYHR